MHDMANSSSLRLLSITQDWLKEISKAKTQITQAVQIMENNFGYLTTLSQQPDFQLGNEMQMLLEDFCESLDAWHLETIQHTQTMAQDVIRGAASLNQLVNMLDGGRQARTEVQAEPTDNGSDLNDTLKRLKDKESAVAALRDDIEALEDACRKLEAQRYYLADTNDLNSQSAQPDEDIASLTPTVNDEDTDYSTISEQDDRFAEVRRELEAQIFDLNQLLEEERNKTERLESRQTVMIAELNTLRAADLARREALVKEREKNQELTEELVTLRNAVVDYPAVEINNDDRVNSAKLSPETTYIDEHELLLDEDDWAVVEEDSYSQPTSQPDNQEEETSETDAEAKDSMLDVSALSNDQTETHEAPVEKVELYPDVEPEQSSNANPEDEDTNVL